MSAGFEEDGKRTSPKAPLYAEDALILLCIAALFVLTVFFRDELWAQVGLGVLLVVMGVVCVRRFRRIRKAFKGGGGDV